MKTVQFLSLSTLQFRFKKCPVVNFDPTLSGVSTSVGVGVGAYADDPYWDYYPYRDGWYNDWRYRRWDHRWNREHYRPYPYYHYDR